MSDLARRLRAQKRFSTDPEYLFVKTLAHYQWRIFRCASSCLPGGPAPAPGRALATASLQALLVGGILAGAGLLRLGFLADFISSQVLAGFKAGMGLFIAASQLDKVLGVPVEGDDFFAKVWSALGQLGDANLATVALGLGGLAALLRWAPKVPGPLVVVVLGIALVAATNRRAAGWPWSGR